MKDILKLIKTLSVKKRKQMEKQDELDLLDIEEDEFWENVDYDELIDDAFVREVDIEEIEDLRREYYYVN